MAFLRFSLSIIASVLITAQVASAQNAPQGQKAPQAVVSAAAGGVRFAAPGQEARRMRLEVYSASGERLFDSDFRAGSILEWKLSDAPNVVADGSYLYVLTVEGLGGAHARSLGAMSLRAGQVSPRPAAAEELKGEFAQALAAAHGQGRKAAGDESAVGVIADGAAPAVTVAAHDGRDGQVTSTSGALTFRTGDVFAGKEQEQMRVTEDGRVGIGTDKPEATLDVAGTIRARGGIIFDDGTVLNTAPRSSSSVVGVTSLSSGTVTPNAVSSSSGGTTNRIAKWTDGTAEVLGDSALTEVGGKLGIGTQTPNYEFTLLGNDVGLQMITPGTGTAATDGFRFGIDSANRAFFWNQEATDLYFGTNKIERMRITDGGNVGIGTNAPTQKLDVAGNIRVGGTGNGIIFPDGTKLTTATTGGSMTGTSIVSAINDPATAGTINDNRLSATLGRRNLDNVWTGSNVFSLGLSANNALVTNVGNPVNAGDAVNKAYTDANFVKFVPGAEQLSVGDANGTAPMINLRGGSTCCSGPGGHTPAFFKVFQNGSFVATGNLGIGTSPMEGKGYRTSWHTYKGAFRSGYADNEWDDANVGFFSWAGGSNSTASGLYALAFGDTNFARSTSSIAFGSGNEVKGAAGFSAGAGNRVCDTYGVALGNNARSGGPYIDGKCDPETFNIRGLAAVAIGYNVTADQDHTMALGKFASNNGFQGTFIWSDGAPQASADTFRNTANNEFAARATGGFRFRTNLGGTTGCNLPAGSGVFNCTSSRTTKENFLAVNGEDVLRSLRKVPVSTWNYTAEGRESRHMGPMAEDFYAAFGLGTSDKSIGVQDLAGVSIAAVKALEARTAELQEKTAEVEQLRTRLNEVEQRLTALEAAIVAVKGAQK